MNKITSVFNERIKELAKLKEKKYRDEKRKFLVEGIDLIEEAFNNGLLETVITTNEKYKSEVEVIYVSDNVLNKLASTKTPSGYVGVCKMKDNPKKLGDKVILLDGLQDPSNVGAIVRSALAFNYDTLLISDDSVDIYNDKLLRASKGYIFDMNIVRDNIDSLLKLLKNNGYYIVVSCLEGAVSLDKAELKEKTAIVIGNEGNGVSKSSLNKASIKVKIDMNNKVESLNASVAAGILMYRLSK